MNDLRYALRTLARSPGFAAADIATLREIGIRMALGASPADVQTLFLRRGGKLAAAGIAIGLVLSAGVTRLLSRMLFGVAPTDAATFGAVSLLLAAVALAAAWHPARRATRIDPMAALRSD